MSAKWLNNNEIGLRVKSVRDRLGSISQAELARRVGRPGSQSVISEIEKGKRDPEAGILSDIAALVGERLDYFQVSVDGAERERRDKLVIADWLFGQAEKLREEATSPPAATRADADAGAEQIDAAEEARGAGEGHEQERDAG